MYTKTQNGQPLIVHVIYRLAIGGLENGLVNLVNNSPESGFKHAIICLTGFTDFKNRIENKDVQVYALNKREGNDWLMYIRLWRLLRKLKPTIVHTRNLAALECQIPAVFANVKYRIHGEHGRDINDITGQSRKYKLLRKMFRSVVTRYIALSKDIEAWLVNDIAIDKNKIVQIYNGVSSEKFFPATAGRAQLPVKGFADNNKIVMGTVGRLQGEKDQLTLVKAFVELRSRRQSNRDKLRLVLVGDGPDRKNIEKYIINQNITDVVWLAGNRDDASAILQALDIFILPSLVEGVSNTILEAMATGLPVIATKVGGNPELVIDNETGFLVPPNQPGEIADAVEKYLFNRALIKKHGDSGRKRVLQEFSLKHMIAKYFELYAEVTGVNTYGYSN